MEFPKKGRKGSEVLKELKELKKNDIDWKNGKSFGLVYYPGDEYADTINTAFQEYRNENTINPQSFPGIQQCHNEVVSMVKSLLNAPENAAGVMTSGGTESILLSVKTAKDYSKYMHKLMDVPEIILPKTAHPAFLKAASYFGLTPRLFDVGNDGNAKSDDVEKLINKNTVLIVASAPSYPHGVIDDIQGISELALKHKILFHVDCCIGGFMLPFLDKSKNAIPDFDFNLEGVTSMSVDIHKYGYSAKGASVLIYRYRSIRKHQFSVFTSWPGGLYGSTTLLGTKSGGSIAAAWTAINTIGEDGYKDLAKKSMLAKESIIDTINSIPELKLIAKPSMSLIAFGSDDIDIFEVADELSLKGWSFGRIQNPNGIHLVVSQIHYGKVVHQFNKDLRDAVQIAKRFSLSKLTHKIQVNSINVLSKLLPNGVLPKIQRILPDPASSKRSAGMYGMMGAVSGEDLDEIVRDILDEMNTK